MKKHEVIGNLFKASIRKSISLAAVVIFTLSLSSCGLFPAEEDVLPPPIQEPPKPEYQYSLVTRGPIQKIIESSASFQSVEQKDLFWTTQGTLKSIYVKPGDIVKKGTLLAEIESKYSARDIQLKEMDIKRAQIQNQISNMTTDSQIRSAKSELDKMKKELAQMTSPEAKGLFPGKDIDAKREAIKNQELNIKDMQTKYNLTLQQQKLDMDRMNADLADTKDEFNKTRLVSPINGQVSNVNTQLKAGSNVPPRQMVVQVSDPSRVLLSYTADESTIQVFTLGLEVYVDDLKGHADLKGKVVQTPTTLTEDGNDILKTTVLISIPGLSTAVKSGDTARIKVILAENKNALKISRTYLKQQLGQDFVYVLKGDTKEQKFVEVGINDGTEVEIKKGLKEGEKVVE